MLDLSKVQFKPGTFVHYFQKNELGLAGEITGDGSRVWYHMGGTRAITHLTDLKPLTFDQMISMTFNNEYAKASLIERYYRLQEGGDVSDLIDERHIRPVIIKLLKELKGG